MNDPLNAQADALTRKAQDLQKQKREQTTETMKKKFMDAERVHADEYATLSTEQHLEPEMISRGRLKAARQRDEDAFQAELATEMMACLIEGDIAGVYNLAKGKKQRKSDKLISQRQKSAMEKTVTELLGKPHDEAPDDSKWHLHEADVIREEIANEDAKEWETYWVDGSYYGLSRENGIRDPPRRHVDHAMWAGGKNRGRHTELVHIRNVVYSGTVRTDHKERSYKGRLLISQISIRSHRLSCEK